MARLSKDGVSIPIETTYNGAGAEQAKQGMEDAGKTVQSTAEKMQAQLEKVAESARKTWAEFTKERMGSYMKESSEQGMAHAEAHTAAIRKIAAEWKVYKETAVQTSEAVTSSMSNMDAAFYKGQASALEWEKTTAAANRSLAGSSATAIDPATESMTKMGGAIDRIKGAWFELISIYMASQWFVGAAKDALDAERAFNQLRIQIEGMGIDYRSVSSEVEKAVQSSANYARIQGEDVARTLQELQFHTGKYQESLEYLNLTLDLAYQKHTSNSEAALLVGKALAGNVEMLGRIIPELRNLDETLGKNADEADRVAYAMAVLRDKAEGAREKMTEHEKEVARAANAYKDLKQAIGGVLLDMAVSVVLIPEKASRIYRDLADSVEHLANKINPNIVTTQAAAKANKELEAAIKQTWQATQKSAEQIAEESRKKSEAIEKEKERKKATDELNKSISAQIEDLSKQYYKLTMDTESYLEYEKGLLLARGANKKLVEEYITVIKNMTEAQEQAKEAQRYQDIEKRILDVSKAIAQLQGDKAGLLTIEAQELVSMGASTAQLEAYLKLRKEQLELDSKTQEQKKTPALEAHVEEFNRVQQMQQDLQNAWKASTGTYYDELISMHKKYGDAVIQQELEKASLRGYIAQNSFAMMSDLMQNLYVATGSKNRAMFEAMKAFAISETVIKTYLGAQEAYSALAGIPVVGPALAVAAAAAAIASGMARVQAIQSQSFGSSTTVSSSGQGYTDYSGGSYDSTAVPTDYTTETKQAQDITINIYNPLSDQNWQKVVEDNIIPAINDAADRNISITVNKG